MRIFLGGSGDHRRSRWASRPPSPHARPCVVAPRSRSGAVQRRRALDTATEGACPGLGGLSPFRGSPHMPLCVQVKLGWRNGRHRTAPSKAHRRRDACPRLPRLYVARIIVVVAPATPARAPHAAVASHDDRERVAQEVRLRVSATIKAKCPARVPFVGLCVPVAIVVLVVGRRDATESAAAAATGTGAAPGKQRAAVCPPPSRALNGMLLPSSSSRPRGAHSLAAAAILVVSCRHCVLDGLRRLHSP